MMDESSVGQQFKQAFGQILSITGSKVLIHKNFQCPDSNVIETVAVKSKKRNSNTVIFQFPDRLDLRNGDVVQQVGSRDYWKIYDTEDTIIGGVFVDYTVCVEKIRT